LAKSKAIVVIIVVGAVTAASLVAFFLNHALYSDALWNLVNEAAHILLFAALAWAAYFIGRLASRVVFRQGDSYWEIDLALGFIIFGLAAFALGAVHLLYPWVIRAVVLVILALSAPLLWRYGREADGFFRARFSSLTRGPVLVAVVLLPLAAAVIVRVGLPPFEWDSLVYHIYVPKVYAEAHGFVYLPRLAYASMPLGAEMMFTWAYLWDGVGCAAAVSPLVNALMMVATWRLARRYLDNLWATAAAAFVFLTPTFLIFFTSANVDMILGAFALMSLLVYLRGLRNRGDAALAGFLLGAALGVKYTGIYALIGFAPVVALDLYRRRVAVRRLAVFFVVALVMVLPWLAKAYVERGNPFYPTFYNVFGGRGITPVMAEQLGKWQKQIGMGRELRDYLKLPYRVSVQADQSYIKFDGIILPFSIATLLLSVLWFRRGRILLYTAFYFGAWAVLASQQLRFLSAALGTLAITAAGVFAYVAAQFKGRLRTATSTALIGAVVVFGYAVNSINCFPHAGEAIKYIPTRDVDRYLYSVAPVYRADKVVNDYLPEDAVILMIFNDHLLYLERRAIYDSFFEASDTLTNVAKLKSPSEVADYVEGLGATHIFSGRFAEDDFWSHYDRATRVLWETYLDGYTTLIYDDRPHFQFEIRAITPRRWGPGYP
jgi:hypothetical protein